MSKKEIKKRANIFFLMLMALVFTIGLTFVSVEIPKVIDKLVSQKADFLDVATGQDELTEYKTELFLSHYHIRTIGYLCLALLLILIIVGFALEKHRLASTGAIFLFLPVFGHFAATMFFLGGLAFLRFLWLPLLDISFDTMRFGDIILLPYKWILDGAELIGLNLYKVLPYIITGIGLFIFLVGVLTWMVSKIRKQNVTDFWIYRLSRHPQYLGWIIWSYGILFLPGPNMRQYVQVANSLPWLLSTMIIIGVALMEERKMKEKYGQSYETFREKAPFLFPLPRLVRKIFSLPLKLVFRNAYPDRKREIASVVLFYTALLILLSAFSIGKINLSKKEIASNKKIDQLVQTIKTSKQRIDIRQSASTLAEIGGVAVDSLIQLLKNQNVFVRWYCADVLGAVKSDKVVQPLAELLYDTEHNVRRAAADALGGTGSSQAISILINALQNPDMGVESDAARSLGKLDAVEALPFLIDGLQKEPVIARWCAWALGEIGSNVAIEPLVFYLENGENCDYNMTGDALRKLGSERAEDAYIAGLQSDKWWIQSGSATALGELQTEKGLTSLKKILSDGEVQVRRAAVLALAKYPEKQAQLALEQALDDEDWEVRLYAKAALEKMRFKSK